jgi:agmatine/peptidylarginine deiminase
MGIKMKKLTILISLLFLLNVFPIITSESIDIDSIEITNTDMIISNSLYNSPPPHPVRQVAEFEPMEGVLVRYPFGIPYDLIAEMSEDVTVLTIVENQAEEDFVIAEYNSNGVDTNNCIFLQAVSDSYWTRDYGPWYVFPDTDTLSIVDFTYHVTSRPNDNLIPGIFADEFGYPDYFMNLRHVGGNYMTDGQGISVSTDLLYDDNALSPDAINNLMYDYIGIETYHVVEDILAPGSTIKPIDCWAKFLSPDTIMIRRVPSNNPYYDEAEEAVDYFENQISSYGTPYNVVRVDTPNGEPYTNSLILNDKVLVPLTGSNWDDDAIQSYQSAMPGYEVLGFYALPSRPWYGIDALHCRAKGIPDDEMLYIEHIPLSNEQISSNGFEIETKIIPYSGGNIISSNTKIYYKINSGSWKTIPLISQGNNNYNGTIPHQDNSSIITYYIHAEDTNGKKESHPFIGSSDPHFFIAIDPNAPSNPTKPSGPKNGLLDIKYDFSTISHDPNNDTIQYGWDWDGNSIVDDWTDFYESGIEINIFHSWHEVGTYNIKVKARNSNGSNSSFSDELTISIYENSPPYPPSNPYPENGSTDVSIITNISWIGEDPNSNDILTYDIYLGTDYPPDILIHNHSSNIYYPEQLSYNTKYYWRIVTWDWHGQKSSGPVWEFTTMEINNPPVKPLIVGIDKGTPGEEYEYCIENANDPDNDQVLIFWDWGDNNESGWLGPYPSGDEICTSHIWTEKGTYTIRAKLKDIYGAESEWSDPFIISMPKSHYFNFQDIILRFLNQYMIKFPILGKILNL